MSRDELKVFYSVILVRLSSPFLFSGRAPVLLTSLLLVKAEFGLLIMLNFLNLKNADILFLVLVIGYYIFHFTYVLNILAYSF